MSRADRSRRYFLALARGESIRTVSMRPAAFVAGLAAVPVVWGLSVMGAMTVYDWMSPPIVAIKAHQAEIRAAYEDRLVAMQAQMDASERVDAGRRDSLETQIRSLEHRETDLETHADVIARIAHSLGAPGSAASAQIGSPNASPADLPITLGDRRPEPATGSMDDEGVDGAEKPTPDGVQVKSLPDKTSSLEGTSPGRLQARLGALSSDLDRMQKQQIDAVDSVAARVAKQAATGRALLSSVGLSPDRFARASVLASADAPMGGPYVPIRLDAPGTPLEIAFEQLQTEMSRDEPIIAALPRLPVRSPLPGRLEMTSPFGVRVDPFLGRLALHPGEDLRASVGEAVSATADGRVTNASYDGGYGNMVEIDHGDGVATRYGHLSAIEVHVGQHVSAGQEIGKTGSTGRSTGPHLHYEVRIDGQPVDPKRFIEASRTFASNE